MLLGLALEAVWFLGAAVPFMVLAGVLALVAARFSKAAWTKQAGYVGVLLLAAAAMLWPISFFVISASLFRMP